MNYPRTSLAPNLDKIVQMSLQPQFAQPMIPNLPMLRFVGQAMDVGHPKLAQVRRTLT
jgi:hypothetical protein